MKAQECIRAIVELNAQQTQLLQMHRERLAAYAISAEASANLIAPGAAAQLSTVSAHMQHFNISKQHNAFFR
eukprot:15562-Heterococcus_DN1.PRE.2